MATLRQRKAAKLFLGSPRTAGEIMREAGYAENSAIAPTKNLLESKGFKEALAEYGLTEELITTSLVDDIEKKPKKRIMELNLGAEILGMKKREVNNQINVIVPIYGGQSISRYDSDKKDIQLTKENQSG